VKSLKTDTLQKSLKTDTLQKSLKTDALQKSLKIPKEESESVNRRRTDNMMAKRKRTKGQSTIYKTYT
jgi:hypothetical protein